MTTETTRRRPFVDVAEGETIYAHGIPLQITRGAVRYSNGDAIGGEVLTMIGTYRGDDLAPHSGLYPFVKVDGDEWTIQRATPFAFVTTYDDGATWLAPF